MAKSPRKKVPDVGIELGAACIRSGHASDRATAPGLNDNIYHEGNISKMPDFDVFSLLEIRKRKSRSHGIRKKGNGKRKKKKKEKKKKSAL